MNYCLIIVSFEFIINFNFIKEKFCVEIIIIFMFKFIKLKEHKFNLLLVFKDINFIINDLIVIQ
jgi:hypothetical protein